MQYRTAERGDTIFAIDVKPQLRATCRPAKAEKKEGQPEKNPDITSGRTCARTSASAGGTTLLTSPDGSKLAFVTNAINQRQEKYEDVEIYVVDSWRLAPTAQAASRSPRTRLSKATALG